MREGSIFCCWIGYGALVDRICMESVLTGSDLMGGGSDTASRDRIRIGVDRIRCVTGRCWIESGWTLDRIRFVDG